MMSLWQSLPSGNAALSCRRASQWQHWQVSQAPAHMLQSDRNCQMAMSGGNGYFAG
jgi:hypothetical protein